MKTPKTSHAILPLLFLSFPVYSMDINPALRNIRDYPDPTPHFDNALNNIPYLPAQPPMTTHTTKQVYIELPTTCSPDPTPIDPNSLKLNLDLPPAPQLMFTPPNPLTPPAAPATPAPSATTPATSPKK